MMVNCVNCHRSFKSRIGKGKGTRCERCAKVWRESQIKEENDDRLYKNRELDIKEKELEFKQKQLEMDRQKVTIRESFSRGETIELTCYYDDKTQEKIKHLLQGTHCALPSPSTKATTTTTSNSGSSHNRSTSSEDNACVTAEDIKTSRKLPSIDGLKSRITSRHRLQDEGSSFGSGASID